MEIGAAVAIVALVVGFGAGYFVRSIVSWRDVEELE
jgi:fructose-specific phosphotransferase system IIC component